MSRVMNSETDTNSRLSVRPREAAELLGVSSSSFDRLVKDEEIPFVKVRGMRLFSLESLREWIKRKEKISHSN